MFFSNKKNELIGEFNAQCTFCFLSDSQGFQNIHFSHKHIDEQTLVSVNNFADKISLSKYLWKTSQSSGNYYCWYWNKFLFFKSRQWNICSSYFKSDKYNQTIDTLQRTWSSFHHIKDFSWLQWDLDQSLQPVHALPKYSVILVQLKLWM